MYINVKNLKLGCFECISIWKIGMLLSKLEYINILDIVPLDCSSERHIIQLTVSYYHLVFFLACYIAASVLDMIIRLSQIYLWDISHFQNKHRLLKFFCLEKCTRAMVVIFWQPRGYLQYFLQSLEINRDGKYLQICKWW